MPKSLPYIVLVFISNVLFSYNVSTEPNIVHAELPVSNTKIPDSLKETTPLDKLVNEVAKLTRFEGKYVGYDGRLSSQRNYLKDFIELADTASLLKLSSHKSPIVRILSFDALAAKNFRDIKNVFKNHISDNETYELYGGCLITPEPVNLSMYNTIEDRLTHKEKAHFGKLLKEQLKKSNYWAFSLIEASL